MSIEFPARAVYDQTRCSVAFPVLIDQIQHRCLITEEALQDHFGANEARAPAQFVDAFERNRAEIETIASRHIRNGARNEILLKSEHF